MRPHGGDAFFVLDREGERRLGLRLSSETTLASVVTITRAVSPVSFAPMEVHLRRPAPRSTAAHEAFFGCPIVFGADLDALLVSAEALQQPNRLGDERITKFLLAHLDETLKRFEAHPPLEGQVSDAIVRSLSDGVPKMPAVTRRLRLSERSLQRRLADRGLSFQRLVDDTRRDLAEGLLARSDYSLAEVAFLTGFSEQSAFQRAFKQWTDRTPGAYRETNGAR